ncbi:MAG: hypothetical protein GTO63_17410, partial [Anaerolineae bacterium]|nr:hypothetical protein [Anaerolineae bacterium]NIN96572.1 hypothetical protein [Anaerolineae bacterium]NIQ79601.1 hypothetical protein [Anaerolineae bacterium]
MTEISNLYGYYWLVKGKSDEWSYELFEDIRHAQRRDQLRQDYKDRAEILMADSTESARRLLDTW